MTTSWGLDDWEATSHIDSDGRIVREYMERWRYRTSALTRPTADDISTDMGIYPGSPYFEDTNATLFDVSIKGVDQKTLPPHLQYFVSLKWATDAPLPVSTSTDPTTRRTIWKIRPNIQQRFITKYLVGTTDTLIVNTAGQPPDGGVPVDVRLGTAVATRNITAVGYNKASVLANSGKLNSVAFLGGAIGTVQVDIETDETYEGAYHFWAETYTFNYDPNGHQPKFPSAGFYQREAVGSNTLVRIQQDGQDVQEPEPLDTNGILVPIGSRPTSCAIVTVPFFLTMDFNTFGL